MILVLANQDDAVARSLVDQWADYDARLVVPQDLSVVGWRYRSGSLGGSRAMVEGAPVPIEDVHAVLVRAPCVMNADLRHIQAADRDYVATEMTSFLLAWLTSLDCPVINRPTPYCLQGPAFRTEQWIHLAARAGVPVTTVRRTTAKAGAPHQFGSTVVTVVGDESIGATTDALDDYARRIARAADASVLNTYFTGPPEAPVFTGADVWVDLEDPVINDAVLSLLVGEEAEEVYQ